MREIKSHLIEKCDFNEAMVKDFFTLFNYAPFALCRMYHASTPRKDHIQDKVSLVRITSMMVRAIVSASTHGPRPDKMDKALKELR